MTLMVFKVLNQNEDEEEVEKLYLELTKGMRTHQKDTFFGKISDILKSVAPKLFDWKQLSIFNTSHCSTSVPNDQFFI